MSNQLDDTLKVFLKNISEKNDFTLRERLLINEFYNKYLYCNQPKTQERIDNEKNDFWKYYTTGWWIYNNLDV